MQIEPDRRARHEQDFAALLLRFGAQAGEPLGHAISQYVEQTLEALEQSAEDGHSLTPLAIVRIRANKFAAAQLPAAVFRDPAQLASLRAAILQLARLLLGEDN